MKENIISKPIIYEIDDNMDAVNNLAQELVKEEKHKDLILDYPIVYIHNWKESDRYEIYIGEANDFVKRTHQHHEEALKENVWQNNILEYGAKLFVIGHEHFNKSLTLDIENSLMNFMLGVEKVEKIHNKRGNPQNKYFPSNEKDIIFRKIWTGLGKKNSELFPKARLVTDSAIFKASPLHTLTKEQESIKTEIVAKVKDKLKNETMGDIIFVSGEAGTGKTVLNSSLFYELTMLEESEIDCHLVVNHDEQLTVYQQIAKKLNIANGREVVSKPTRFINRYGEDSPVDVVLIDEAHLLLTRGKQSYTGKNQLDDIRKRAKVVIVMFDKRQILRTEQYWENEKIERLELEARDNESFFKLERQLRITGSAETVNWINQFTQNQVVEKIPKDENYEIRIFDNPSDMEKMINEKAQKEDTKLSRMVATFDWAYNGNHSPEDRFMNYWNVSIGEWSKPWNLQLEVPQKERKRNKGLAWAEQSQTVGEVGSTYTIQGFDLSYAGVILGPSVKYKDGKIFFDPKESKNKSATTYRTLDDGTRQKFGEQLISNEVNVLMTRGVKGLYIYACDDKLREVLKKAVG